MTIFTGLFTMHYLRNALSRCMPIVLGTRGQQRLTVLAYHRVLPKYDPLRPLEPVVEEFRWQMELLANYFTPLSLPKALKLLDAAELPERAVCVTFDDGYSNNEAYALPVLKHYGVPATVFIATGFLNGGMMWNDKVCECVRIMDRGQLDLTDQGLEAYDLSNVDAKRRSAVAIIAAIKHWPPEQRSALVSSLEQMVDTLPADMMMTDEQVKNLSNNGIDVGAHTCTHPILARLSNQQAMLEIQQSRQYLEQLLGKSVRFFAYPNGKPNEDYLPEHKAVVKKCGFEGAFSTHWGAVSMDSDRWQLPRFTPWDRSPTRFLLRLMANYRNPA